MSLRDNDSRRGGGRTGRQRVSDASDQQRRTEQTASNYLPQRDDLHLAMLSEALVVVDGETGEPP